MSVSVEVPGPVPAVNHHANQEQVKVNENIKQARDRAQYVRTQKGHSLIAHLLLGTFVLWVNVIYISVSPNHYWTA